MTCATCKRVVRCYDCGGPATVVTKESLATPYCHQCYKDYLSRKLGSKTWPESRPIKEWLQLCPPWPHPSHSGCGMIQNYCRPECQELRKGNNTPLVYQSEETLAVRDDDVFTYTWSPRSNPDKVLCASGSLESITKVAQLLWADHTVLLRAFRNTRTDQPFDKDGRPWPLIPHEGSYAWQQPEKGTWNEKV